MLASHRMGFLSCSCHLESQTPTSAEKEVDDLWGEVSLWAVSVFTLDQ